MALTQPNLLPAAAASARRCSTSSRWAGGRARLGWPRFRMSGNSGSARGSAGVQDSKHIAPALPLDKLPLVCRVPGARPSPLRRPAHHTARVRVFPSTPPPLRPCHALRHTGSARSSWWETASPTSRRGQREARTRSLGAWAMQGAAWVCFERAREGRSGGAAAPTTPTLSLHLPCAPLPAVCPGTAALCTVKTWQSCRTGTSSQLQTSPRRCSKPRRHCPHAEAALGRAAPRALAGRHSHTPLLLAASICYTTRL